MTQIDYSSYVNKLSLKNKVYRFIWNVSWFFLFRPFHANFFNKWRIFLVQLFGAKIGNNCAIKSTVKIWSPKNLIMGNHCLIDEDCICYNVAKIQLEGQVVISARTSLITASHNINSINHELVSQPIIIKKFVWITAETFIGPGVTIGEGAVIAARAVVVKDVEPWTVVGGNPAKFIKKRVIEN